MTLEDAKKQLRENFAKGTNCPCCGQFVKQYKRKLNTGMAIFLIYLSKESSCEYVLSSTVLKSINLGTKCMDFSLLKHWHLIEEMPNNDPKKRSSGYWKITPQGLKFVNNETRVPSHVFIYNSVFMGFEPTGTTSIVESLGKNFNYDELMR